MQLEIPQDIVDITRKCQWEFTEYAEFDLSISVTKEGEILIRDMLGLWAGDRCSEDLTSEEAWTMIRKWWIDEAESRKTLEAKAQLEFEIMMKQEEVSDLEEKVKALNKKAERKRWFW